MTSLISLLAVAPLEPIPKTVTSPVPASKTTSAATFPLPGEVPRISPKNTILLPPVFVVSVSMVNFVSPIVRSLVMPDSPKVTISLLVTMVTSLALLIE